MVSMASSLAFLVAFAGHVLDRLTGKELQEPPPQTGNGAVAEAAATEVEEVEDEEKEEDGQDAAIESDVGSEYDSFCRDDSLDTRLKKCWARDCSGHLAEANHDLYLRDVPLVGYCNFHNSNFCCWHRRSLPRD
jgi:hypothetical protein